MSGEPSKYMLNRPEQYKQQKLYERDYMADNWLGLELFMVNRWIIPEYADLKIE